MRLGLASSPPMAPQTSSYNLSSSSPSPRRDSTAFAITVDDSGDEAEPNSSSNSQMTITPASSHRDASIYQPFRLTSNRQTQQPTVSYESSDSSGGEEKKSGQGPDAKPALNFFFNMTERNTPPRRRRESRHSTSSSVRSSPTRLQNNQAVAAVRTSVCGERFDRCELDFEEDRVEMTIWKEKKRIWRGQVMFQHLRRFCFAKVNKPPYILLMQLDEDLGRSELATFYDSIFAKMCEQNNAKERSASQVFGVVLYFDEEVSYMRCQSMADNNRGLAELFSEQLRDKEVHDFTKWYTMQKYRDQHPRRLEEAKSRISSSSGGRTLASMVGNGARNALVSVKDFFNPRTSVLEDVSNPPVVSNINGAGRKLMLSRNPETPVHSDEEKSVSGSTKPQSDGETVVLITSTQQDEVDSAEATSSLQEERKSAMGKKRAAAHRREEEKVKRRRIESRRNEVVLTYPYDDSETAGRISVTLGDVDRLVPGEFLNDNIIDFYLRFLWRHLESWQQQQTYFFTSHFFTQLNGTNGAHELAGANPDERFARVARWTQKETGLFNKRFLFIPTNDSFHWSIAVFCNPGSAVIKKRRTIKHHYHHYKVAKEGSESGDVVDLVREVDSDGTAKQESSDTTSDDGIIEDGKVEEEELADCQKERLANPPCLLFLDSLRCHRKKKFTKMLRNYLECEWKARYSGAAKVKEDPEGKTEDIVTSFDADSIGLLEPNIPLQSNSSDCGVFLLMYAASIVSRFPMGVNREDLESHLTSTLTPNMFGDEHVLEFREYLQQLIFCLQFLQKHGLEEAHVRDEGLDLFTID